MIKYYSKQESALVELAQPEKNCWINVYPPFNQENLKRLGDKYNIPFDYLIDSLDVDERPRFEREDDIELIVLKTPIVNDIKTDVDANYITVPIGIILGREAIVTISPYVNPVMTSFVNDQVKRFNPADHSSFVLKLFERNVHYFLHFLNEINMKRNAFEQELYSSMRNQDLIKLVNIEKSLVYFITALRANELLMMKIRRIDFLEITKKKDESDLLEDIIVDNGQALEMSNTYANILGGSMDAFASVISNNLNIVMRRLTSVTILLMVPTLVASLYGMNIELPYAHESWAFLLVLLISVGLATLIAMFFLRKRWF
jgi:magnesium transporter